MKPILFNTPMVRAITDGRKTQFRIPIKLGFEAEGINMINAKASGVFEVEFENFDNDEFAIIRSRYQVDDIIYVKETFNFDDEMELPYYKADFEDNDIMVWKPSVHMPKKYARIFLKITNVRVERLQDITPHDIFMEGVKPKNSCHLEKASEHAVTKWEELWNSTAPNGKWEDNPFVFVYDFERVGQIK